MICSFGIEKVDSQIVCYTLLYHFIWRYIDNGTSGKGITKKLYYVTNPNTFMSLQPLRDQRGALIQITTYQ